MKKCKDSPRERSTIDDAITGASERAIGEVHPFCECEMQKSRRSCERTEDRMRT